MKNKAEFIAVIIAHYTFKAVVVIAFIYLALKLSLTTGNYWFLWFLVIPALQTIDRFEFRERGKDDVED